MNVFLEGNDIQALATALRWDKQEATMEKTYFSSLPNQPHTRILSCI
jgi:hypothetical protein